MEGPKLSPILCLEIFGKSAFRETKKQNKKQTVTKDGEGIPRLIMTQREEKSASLPEVVAFGDGILGKRCIKSRERVLGYTFFNVQVQVTIPPDVYSYFSTLKEKDEDGLTFRLYTCKSVINKSFASFFLL